MTSKAGISKGEIIRPLDLYIPLNLILVSALQGRLQNCPLDNQVLSTWKDILTNLHFTISLMPRDIATCWNSTFDLLVYALKHRKAVHLLTQWCELGLRKFELSNNEWATIEQLHSILKVSNTMIQHVWSNTHKPNLIGPQGCHTFLLALDTKPCNGHPSDGPYQSRAYDIFTR